MRRGHIRILEIVVSRKGSRIIVKVNKGLILYGKGMMSLFLAIKMVRKMRCKRNISKELKIRNQGSFINL
jgi:hypothetical protein